MSEKTCHNCSTEPCTAKNQQPNESDEQFMERQQLHNRLCRIKHKILVLSGKGGVGKSTVAANLAVSLALAGKKVGLLDVDIHGPSIPKLLNLEHSTPKIQDESILPIELGENLKVMSIGFLLRGNDEAIIWRGPMKMGVIKQFLKDVDWGDLDFMIIDLPPGTGDEPLSVCQLIEDADGGIVVTTPQEIALADVRKSIQFCSALKLPVLGVVENMSGFVCPKCGEITEIFKRGGGEAMAKEKGVPFLGRIPLDPQIVEASDLGKPYIYHYAKTETAKAFEKVIQPILQLDEKEDYVSSCAGEIKGKPVCAGTKLEDQDQGQDLQDTVLRIAIPVANGQLCPHFGHCEEFALVDVDPGQKKILAQKAVPAPEHQPGLLPPWLAEQGAQLIICGGMGSRAQGLFSEHKIAVRVGTPIDTPEAIVKSFLEGTLKTGENICDH